MQQRVECPCKNWHWREVTLATGLAAIERVCPRCRSRVLVLFRGSVFVVAIRFGGAHERPLEEALAAADLHPHEREILLMTARLTAAC